MNDGCDQCGIGAPHLFRNCPNFQGAKTMVEMKRVKYKKYAGILIRDRSLEVELIHFKPGNSQHLKRAAYLATMLESPHWGTVQGYDNCGLSAGPFHWIGRYPRTGEQGPLFGLLRRIEQCLGDSVQSSYDGADSMLNALWNKFTRARWYISMDGKLRHRRTGVLISGSEFRDVVAPAKGKVPTKGHDRDQAEGWALMLHDLLKEPLTYSAQVDYAVEYLVRGQSKLEMKVYRKLASDPELQTAERIHLHKAYDLAMCVYHAFSVNAPSKAAQILKTMPLTQAALEDPYEWSGKLIKKLGTSKYGNWRKRYAKTRKIARASDLWWDFFFLKQPQGDGVMPGNFK